MNKEYEKPTIILLNVSIDNSIANGSNASFLPGDLTNEPQIEDWTNEESSFDVNL